MKAERMAAHIDRRLIDKIVAAGDSGQVEAIIVVQGSEETSPGEEGDGLARQVVDSSAQRVGALPHTVRYFPRANAAVLSAKGNLIQEILKDERLAVASASDLDVFPFSRV